MAMKLPVDSTGMSFTVASEPRPVTDFATKQPKTDEHGAQLYAVKLFAFCDGEADQITVKVSGMPTGLVVGKPATVSGLTAQAWSTSDGKSGVAFRADTLGPVVSGSSSSRSSQAA